jgi:hypothetical protein
MASNPRREQASYSAPWNSFFRRTEATSPSNQKCLFLYSARTLSSLVQKLRLLLTRSVYFFIPPELFPPSYRSYVSLPEVAISLFRQNSFFRRTETTSPSYQKWLFLYSIRTLSSLVQKLRLLLTRSVYFFIPPELFPPSYRSYVSFLPEVVISLFRQNSPPSYRSYVSFLPEVFISLFH